MGCDDVARALARGEIEEAPISASDRAMLRYALDLTHDPHSITEEDVLRLRQHGFDDTAIHDVCHVTSYYNYVNRMAEGLGVELEEGWTEEALTLTREEFESRAGAGRLPQHPEHEQHRHREHEGRGGEE